MFIFIQLLAALFGLGAPAPVAAAAPKPAPTPAPVVTPAPTTPAPTTPTPTTPAPTTPANPAPAAGGAGLYVALGDSYSSGWGSEITPAQGAAGIIDRAVHAGQGCGRTTNNAARQIVAAKGYTLRDVSCGGANTDTVLRTGQNGEPAQINGVTSDAKLVTLTIGGNDAAMLYLIFCAKGGMIQCFWGFDAVAADVNNKATAMGPKVAATLAEIRKRAPQAEIRIAGYPYLLPVPGAPLGNCAAWLTPHEQQVAKTVQDRANGLIKAAAEAAGPGVRYVDPFAAGSGFIGVDEFGTRDLCSPSKHRWINGALDTNAVGPEHPNALGYRYYADLYLASLGGGAAPAPTPAPNPTPAPTTPAPAPTPAPVPAIPAGSKYVSLGDSYSSGGGAETTPVQGAAGTVVDVYEKTTGWFGFVSHNGCYRANNSAAQLIAKARGLKLVDASCGGATTDTLLRTGQFGQGAQVNHVTADTKLVTLTIGGNDAGLLNLLPCVRQQVCSTDNQLYRTMANTVETQLPARLAATLAEIKKRAPGAQIRLAGYPYLLPAPGAPLSQQCAGEMTQAELVVAKNLQDRASAIAQAAATAAGPNVRFVDTHVPGSPFDAVDEFGTRDICSGSQNRWINGIIDTKSSGGFHPNSKGYQYYAQLYLATI